MQRVSLQGEDLAGFPEDAEGNYIKLIFPTDDADKPILRTYTVSEHRAGQCEIDVDFMLHGTAEDIHGVAAPWSITAKAGDKLSIFGPGNASYINVDADWFLVAADMTALPAMTANLSRLPTDARGYAVIEILSEEDKQDLPFPKGIEPLWVINPHPGSDESPLYHAIKDQGWLDGQVAIWCACEFKTMKKIRQYFKADRDVIKSHLYISSYWKQGLNEEQHKLAKREDAF